MSAERCPGSGLAIEVVTSATVQCRFCGESFVPNMVTINDADYHPNGAES